MGKPEFERAKQYALERLERDLPPVLIYHAAKHTRDDVVPAATRLASLEKIDGEAVLLLLTAAWYHDLGFIEQMADNEEIAVQMAVEVLPRFGYSPQQIEVISQIILATRITQTPQSLLEQIMVDADLDSLGREDFWITSWDLRRELAALGMLFSDEDWYRYQLDFLRQHCYYTQAAQTLRTAGKQRNMDRLKQLLAECKNKDS